MSSKMLLNPKSREEAEQNESTLYEAFPISMRRKVYLPHFTIKKQLNVGKYTVYTIHGWYGFICCCFNIAATSTYVPYIFVL